MIGSVTKNRREEKWKLTIGSVTKTEGEEKWKLMIGSVTKNGGRREMETYDRICEQKRRQKRLARKLNRTALSADQNELPQNCTAKL